MNIFMHKYIKMELYIHFTKKQSKAMDESDESERGERKSWLKAQHSEN